MWWITVRFWDIEWSWSWDGKWIIRLILYFLFMVVLYKILQDKFLLISERSTSNIYDIYRNHFIVIFSGLRELIPMIKCYYF